MQRNPYSQDFQSKLKGAAAVIISAALLFILIYSLTDHDVITSLSESIIFISILSLTGYYYWYISDFLAAFQAKILFTLAILGITSAATYAILSMTGICKPEEFKAAAPAIVITGLLFWIILLQDYYQYKFKTKEKSDSSDELIYSDLAEKEEIEEAKKIDRISVKEGSKIHLIEAYDILFIQAYGDYAMINTEEGKYLKEKTMKYFETNLPDDFLRIHRSCIVNTSKIARAELFGKESYYIYLKNGACIRASSTGYKLLKEKLQY